MHCRRLAIAGLLAATAGCGVTDLDDGDEAGCTGGKCDEADDELEDRSVCVALRGNGERIFGIIAGVARVVENYGLLDGAAGGSSASITTFFVESVHRSPLVHECGYRPCTAEQSAARAALMLKSIQGYAEVLATSDEGLAFGNLAPIASRVGEAGLADLAAQDIQAATASLIDLLSSDDLRELVNPEVLRTIQESPDPNATARDFIDAFSAFGSFSTQDPAILVRPGLVDFEGVADKVGRIGSFYAGYAPADTEGLDHFLRECAMATRGMTWREAAETPAGDSTCGALLGELVTQFRDDVRADEDAFESRIDDAIGSGFTSLVPTSVLVGDAAATWREARAGYAQAQPWTLDVDFADIRLGFFGAKSDLDRMLSNPRGYDDAKTARTIGLPEVSWRTALALSPAEPGLARALEIDDAMVSAGGWPDLHPILALKNVGCDEVVYVSRAGIESSFATGVAKLLGATDDDVDSLYGVGRGSGFGDSLAEADATLCTNWNDISGTDLDRITADAYFADLETDDPFFTDGPTPYEGVIPRSQGRTGCSLQD